MDVAATTPAAVRVAISSSSPWMGPGMQPLPHLPPKGHSIEIETRWNKKKHLAKWSLGGVWILFLISDRFQPSYCRKPKAWKGRITNVTRASAVLCSCCVKLVQRPPGVNRLKLGRPLPIAPGLWVKSTKCIGVPNNRQLVPWSGPKSPPPKGFASTRT